MLAACTRPALGRGGGGGGGKEEREEGAGEERARGPARGWAGAGRPLPGRREVERAGEWRRVRSCAGPPARPSSRRRGSAGPMRKCSPGPSRPAPPPCPLLPAGGGCRGALSADPAAPATAEVPERPAQYADAPPPFLKGAVAFPQATDRVPSACNQHPRARVAGWDFGRRTAGGAGQQARRGGLSQTCPGRCVTLGKTLTLSGLNKVSSQADS